MEGEAVATENEQPVHMTVATQDSLNEAGFGISLRHCLKRGISYLVKHSMLPIEREGEDLLLMLINFCQQKGGRMLAEVHKELKLGGELDNEPNFGVLRSQNDLSFPK